MIDLRSDTVTLPSPEMREVMYRAELGDDVYGEDPSVNALEALAAEVAGKEAGLYVVSGTMGNLCAHLGHTQPGDEVICGEVTHTFMAEQGGPARIGGLSMRTIPQHRASLDPQKVEAAIRPDNIHCPRTGLIWVEEPCNGWVMPLAELEAVVAVGRRYGIPVHMDGARLFNAAVYLGVPAREITQHVDSVMFCVSKGLAAPVGSMLVGSADFIRRARRARKVLGGSMRQAGVIASAGIYAIQKMSQRLAEDHDNARLLAAGLRTIPRVRVDRDEVQTNMFFFEVTAPEPSPQDLSEALRQRGILISAPRRPSRAIRLVTHYGVTREDALAALAAIRELLA